MAITKEELRYEFTVTNKPQIDSGKWVGHGVVQYVDADLTFTFSVHRDGRDGSFTFEPGGVPGVEERVEADLLRVLSQCFAFAVEQARFRFAGDLYDAGAGWVHA